MLRFKEACQVPNHKLAHQPVLEAHGSSLPYALLLDFATWRDVLLTQPYFPDVCEGVWLGPSDLHRPALAVGWLQQKARQCPP